MLSRLVGICIFIFTVGFHNHLCAQSFEPSSTKQNNDTLSFTEKINDNYLDEDEDKKEKGMKPDRPDLAHEQEIELTKDPVSGIVPRERLRSVFTLVKQQRNQRLSQAPAASMATASWTERGPSNVGGRTRALMYDPNDVTNKKVWAGGVGGGLWYTNDISVASPVWINVDDFWANIAISCIAYNPANTQELYVGTGEGWYNSDAISGLGIWKSVDGGNSWTQLSSTNSSTYYQIQKIVISSTGIVYAATRSGGVRRSVDGGNNWTQVLSGRAADLEIGADGTLYASIGIFTTDGIYSSTNGTTWTKRNTGTNGFPTTGFERIEIACAPSDPNILYALTQHDIDNTIENIYMSSNKGITWVTVNKPTDADLGIGSDFTRSQAWYDLIAAVDPANSQNLIIGGVNLFYSTNAGSSWTQISKWSNNAAMNLLSCSIVHADQHAIAFQPGSSSVFLSGNDGGVYLCANVSTAGSSSQFSNKNTGYNVTQFYAAAMHPGAGSNNFIAGAQDNGTQKFTTAGMNSTTSPTGGDGAFCFIDQTNGNYQISSYVYNTYYRTTNNWSTKTTISNSSTTGSFINPADYDDANGILYSSYSTTEIQRISGIRSTPANPVQFTVTGMSAKATHLRVSPYSPVGTTTLFVGTGNAKLYKVTNAQGASPSTSSIGSSSFPSGSISCVEVGTSENELLVTFSNYGVTSVWMTSNGGSTWTSKEGNLPDMPVRWALFNPNNFNEVLLATEVGVWSTSDITASSPAWLANNGNLANVRIDMLQVRSSDKTVIAATHGRGVFSTNYFSSPVADFTAFNTSVCAGSSVSFSDQSTNGPTNWSWSFPGGNPGSSTLQNPLVSYPTAGTYSVSLTAGNSSGSNAITKTNYISIYSGPLVSVSVSAAPSGSICPGTNVTFTAIPSFGGTNPVYQWKRNGTNVGTNSTGYSTNSLVHGDQITCVMTSSESCVSGNPATSNTVNMVVNPNVTAGISISVSPSTTICSGASVSFTANPVNGGSSPVYQWKKNGTNVGTNTSVYSSSSFSDQDQISCIMTSNAPCISGNPASSNTITLSVIQNSTASISISASPSTGICAGENIVFSSTSTNAGSGPSFQWRVNGNNTGINSSTFSSSTLNDGDIVRCQLTSSETCLVSNPVNSNSIPVSVIASVSPSVVISSTTSGAICEGTSVTFSASVSGAGSSPSFQWKVNGNNAGGDSSGFTSNNFTNGDQITCEVTGNANCTVGNPAISNVITMAVNPLLSASINVTISPSSTICSGTSVTLTAHPTNGGSNPVYQWKRNGANIGGNTVTFTAASFANGNQLSCVMTSNASCVTGSPANSNVIVMTVYPNVTASVGISSSPSTTICQGEEVTVSASPVNGGSSPSYQWKINGTYNGVTGPTFTTSALSNGNQVRCEMTSNAPCVSGNPATSNSQFFTVNQTVNPSVIINATPSDTVCEGTNPSYTAIPNNGGPTPSYQWKLNGTNVGMNSSTYQAGSGISGDQVYVEMTSSVNCPAVNPVSSNTLTTINCQSVLALKLFIEGYYTGSGLMRAVADPYNYPSLCDSIKVSLANTFSPNTIYQSVTGTLNTSGVGSFEFSSYPGTNYYIVVQHRNSLESWSSIPVSTGPSMNYDFSTSAAKVYGSNQKNMGDGNFAIISGDINQDMIIDMNDNMLIELSLQNLMSGYLEEDLNGDGLVESSDFSLLENNIGLFITQRP
ncbi:MAG: PKD domain-containing protein [Bacteroidetes bacterium]|nr:MAG: PKD domain-containing protein [Bacteroidota bacterium]